MVANKLGKYRNFVAGVTLGLATIVGMGCNYDKYRALGSGQSSKVYRWGSDDHYTLGSSWEIVKETDKDYTIRLKGKKESGEEITDIVRKDSLKINDKPAKLVESGSEMRKVFSHLGDRILAH